jgi:tetratricopeptide (TPR) repeat protein
MRALHLLIFFSLINLFCFPTRPQASRPEMRAGTSFTQQAKSAEPNFSSSKTKDQQRALTVLRQLLTESGQFEETFLKPVNILYLKYRIADLLWEQDPELAHRLFIERFQEAGSKKLGARGPGSDLGLRMRREILEHLFPHDATLAEELATSFTAQDDAPYMQALSQQATLLVQVATGIMPSSPQRAAVLIQYSFNGWFSPQQVEALQLLRRQLPTRADEIFQQAVSIVERKPTNISNKVHILSPYLFPELDPKDPSQSQDELRARESAKLSAALVKPYLEFVYKQFMGQPVETQVTEDNEFGKASFDVHGMQALAPYFEKYKPELAVAFRDRVTEVKTLIKQNDRQDFLERESELYQQFFSQSVPDLLAKAKLSEIPAERTQIYGQAAYILVSQRKFDEAIELLPHLVESGGEKGSAGDLVYGSAAMAALEKGELERAAKYFKNVTDPDQRTRGFIHLAQTALKQQKTLQAKKFLDEAKQTLKQINVEWAQMHSTVEIANVEAKLDAGHGFQSIEAAIEVLNRSGWGDGNVSGMGPDGITLRMNTYDFSKGLIVLARADFPRALGLAKRIQQKEASAFAQLAVCRGLLRSE